MSKNFSEPEQEKETQTEIIPTKPQKKNYLAQKGQALQLFWTEHFTGENPVYKSSSFWKKMGIGGGAIALLGGGAAVGYTFWKIEASLPDSGEAVTTYARPETLTIKAEDGTILQQIGSVSSEQVDLESVPESLVEAFILSEDRRFYRHGGIDVQGVLRASFVNLRAGKIVEGGSTITQQLARTVYFNREKTLERKLREMRMAQRLEKKFAKDEILEYYLNFVYLGSEAYGVADAAALYFSKSVDELTLAESATLAGVAPAPSFYSPLENPDGAKEQRDLVLTRMEAEGLISNEEAKNAIASSLNLVPSSSTRYDRKAPYFTDYIREQLPKLVAPELLEAGGVVVETTLNPKWQELAEETVADTIAENGTAQGFEQAALVAIDPRDGGIKAMVGGNEFYENQFNRVTQAQRQPGSTFKTFVYATAIATGLSPFEGYRDAPYVVDGYEPKNYNNSYRGWVSMRDALTSSLNVVAVRTLVDIGWNPVIEVAQKMGINSELKPDYSLALGASEVNLLELTSAYGTLANEGEYNAPTSIKTIRDREGKILYQAKTEAIAALDPESSAITTWMLTNVVNSGTGRPAQIGRPAAGKTGTSDDSRDLWFIGYIPQMVTGIWLGNDDNKPTNGSSGTAAAVWQKFMAKVVEEMEVIEFPERPDNFDDREGTIAAEPIEPENSYYNRPQNTATTNNSTPRASRSSTPTPKANRRTTSPTPAPTRTRTPTPNRRNRPAPETAPQPQQSEPARARSTPAPTPKPAPKPAPQPAQPSQPAAPTPAPTPTATPAPTPTPTPTAPKPAPAAAPRPQPPAREATAPAPQLAPARQVAPSPAPAAPAIPIPVEAPPQPAAAPPTPREPEALPTPPRVPN